MFVIVNLWTQRVPCGTSPKLWTMTGGAYCSRLVAMSGRKNLFAHGAGCPAAAGGAFGGVCGCANPTTAKVNPNPVASQYDRLIRQPPAVPASWDRYQHRQTGQARLGNCRAHPGRRVDPDRIVV